MKADSSNNQQELNFGITNTPRPKPTGNLWTPSVKSPASVPVALPVLMVRLRGPFTALDRKVWTTLLHRAWPDMEKGAYPHTISINELIWLFRPFAGTIFGERGKLDDDGEETTAALLWLSLGRLVDTKEMARYASIGRADF